MKIVLNSLKHCWDVTKNLLKVDLFAIRNALIFILYFKESSYILVYPLLPRRNHKNYLLLKLSLLCFLLQNTGTSYNRYWMHWHEQNAEFCNHPISHSLLLPVTQKLDIFGEGKQDSWLNDVTCTQSKKLKGQVIHVWDIMCTWYKSWAVDCGVKSCNTWFVLCDILIDQKWYILLF